MTATELAGIEAILFDLDQTLIDRRRAVEAMYAEAFADHAEVIEKLRDLDQDGEGDRETYFHHWSQHKGGFMDQSIFATDLAAQLRPDPDLIDDLRRWSRRVAIGIITNGGVVTQRAKLRGSGLDRVFPSERVWISQAVGIAKPDPAIFAQVCGALGVLPGRCMYLGDSLESDVFAARQAGLNAVHVRKPLRGHALQNLLLRTAVSGTERLAS